MVRMKGVNILNNRSLAQEEYCNSRKPIKQICAEYHIADRIIYQAIKSGEISKRPRVNDQCMEYIENDVELKYYLCGLIASDGCLWKKAPIIEIGLQRGDKDVLEAIYTRLPIGAKMYYPPNKNIVKLHIRCIPFYEWLVSIGITPHKSAFMKIDFSQIPDAYFFHFLRGYIDGDGSVRKMSENHARLTVTGNEDTMYKIWDKVKSLCGISGGLFAVKTEANFQMYKLAYQKKASVVSLLELMYINATLYLQRKFKISNSICAVLPSN